MSAAITQLGAKNIAGVYSADDGMAGGIATALNGAGISRIPLTGQDAELAGIQRIVAGTQSSTACKAFKPEAEAAAQLAVNLLDGKSIKSLATQTLTNTSIQYMITGAVLLGAVVIDSVSRKSREAAGRA